MKELLKNIKEIFINIFGTDLVAVDSSTGIAEFPELEEALKRIEGEIEEKIEENAKNAKKGHEKVGSNIRANKNPLTIKRRTTEPREPEEEIK